MFYLGSQYLSLCPTFLLRRLQRRTVCYFHSPAVHDAPAWVNRSRPRSVRCSYDRQSETETGKGKYNVLSVFDVVNDMVSVRIDEFDCCIVRAAGKEPSAVCHINPAHYARMHILQHIYQLTIQGPYLYRPGHVCVKYKLVNNERFKPLCVFNYMVTMRYVDQLITCHQNKSRNGYLQIVCICTSSGGLELT